MREIIHVGLGQCGARIALKSFEQLIAEYQIEPSRVCDKPSEGIEVHFNEVGDKKFVPRALLLSRDVEHLTAQPLGLYFNPNNLETDFGDHPSLIYNTLRKELEACSNCQGFQFSMHLSTSSLKSFQEEVTLEDFIAKPTVQNFVVFPTLMHIVDLFSSLNNLRMVSSYNNVVFDNQGLQDYYSKSYKSQLSFADYNSLVAQVINGVTYQMRVPSSNYLTLERLYGVNYALPFEIPKLYFDKTTPLTLQDLLSVKHLVEQEPEQQDKCLSMSMFVKSQTQQPSTVYSQISAFEKQFYQGFQNFQYSVTQAKCEQVILLSRSSSIMKKIKEIKRALTKGSQAKKEPFKTSIPYENAEENMKYAESMIKICEEIKNMHTEPEQPDRLVSSTQSLKLAAVKEQPVAPVKEQPIVAAPQRGAPLTVNAIGTSNQLATSQPLAERQGIVQAERQGLVTAEP